LGIPYARLSRSDFALLGDILIAGKAAGIYSNLKVDAKRFAQVTKIYNPDIDNHKLYKKYAELYTGMFDRVRDIYIDLKNIS
jgi:sugar (pentulose or hexulose) kinase